MQNDLKILKNLEKELKVKLELTENNTDQLYSKLYKINKNGEIIGLGLWDCGISTLNNIIPYLIELPFLRELNIGKNQLTQIDALKELKELSDLNLRENEKLSDIFALRYLTKLKVLKITNSLITDISALENLSLLEVFWLERCKIKDLSPIKDLTKLKELILYELSAKTMPALDKLTNLITLSFANLEFTNLDFVENTTNLKHLSLNFNFVDLSPLRNLTNLLTLHIESEFVKDITPLRGLKNLKTLTLNNLDINSLPPWITDFNMGISLDDSTTSNGYINLKGISKAENMGKDKKAESQLRVLATFHL